MAVGRRRTLAIASDHAGFSLKSFLLTELKDIDWRDLGPPSSERVDYPDFAERVGREVGSGRVDLGVLICGSGIGMCISANKIKGVRAAVVESEHGARLSRAHNDANILCLGARILAVDYAKDIVRTWLDTPFEGGRHLDRVKKIAALETTKEAAQNEPRKSRKK